ncbi:uncharacterized protein A1O5_11472 [Cladophialophora psammophila CBS 110553]|uniref:Uncharacterized protein n=1 Tax=Cladophialophora psammophila CBS 110553 TaxID=1182543 RepID=W9W646_9EURO|nr:uncharacterized protein A1O5_11472 [Cladophialophora psammophila CBS 110553]EXJ63423.1 hypothetical protein A1O5_11472 [Cladophialophora psammophila CBS 110553]
MWYELVKERRKSIANRFVEAGRAPFATLAAAAQADISRSSLAKWDGSARAWLRFADKIKRTEQDQLMLIVANINVPINNDMSVFSSV